MFLLITKNFAKVAQLVEHDHAKVGVAGSSPVFRSNEKLDYHRTGREVYPDYYREFPSFAQKNFKFCPDGGMVDTKDLKSFGFTAVRVQVPLRVPPMNLIILENPHNQLIVRVFLFYFFIFAQPFLESISQYLVGFN